MSTAYDVSVEDITYRATEAGPLLARLYPPRRQGSIPALVSVHGGRWFGPTGSPSTVIDQKRVAQAGIVTLALDFASRRLCAIPEPVRRHQFQPSAGSSNSAQRLGSTSALVGGIGTSSGGNQLMLNVAAPGAIRAMLRSRCPAPTPMQRFLTSSPAGRSSIHLARYRMAKQRNMELHVKSHDAYWPDEASMAEGNSATDRGARREANRCRRFRPSFRAPVTPPYAPEMTHFSPTPTARKAGEAVLETIRRQGPHVR